MMNLAVIGLSLGDGLLPELVVAHVLGELTERLNRH
jgi:hypothetical protein